MAHRLAWALHNGEWPSKQIDHIDGDRANNRISNLREATQSQQIMNSKLRSDNTSGIKGVQQRKYGWTAYIAVDGKSTYLGHFDTKAKAIAARAEAEEKLYREWRCNRT